MRKPIALLPADFCQQAVQAGFNALHKHWALDAYRVDCREGVGAKCASFRSACGRAERNDVAQPLQRLPSPVRRDDGAVEEVTLVAGEE